MKSTLQRALALFTAIVLVWSAAAAAAPGLRSAGALFAAGETEPSEPGTEPAEPGTEPAEPGTEPAEPGTEPAEPGTEPAEPGTEPAEPGTEPAEPGTEPTEPGTEPTEPGTEPTKPACAETGIHVPGAWTPTENGKHVSVCTLCGEPMEAECEYADPAVFTSLGNGTHARLCLICGGPDTPVPCAFDGGAAVPPAQDTPGGVLYTCEACGYENFTETSPAEKDRPESRPMGDADLNGAVEPGDARLILRASLSLQTLSAEALAYADMNGDGDIAPGDARLALRVSLMLQGAGRHEITAAYTETPTCTAAGSLTWNCAYCGDSGVVITPKSAHEWAAATAKKAKHCSVCGMIVPGWQKVGTDDYYFLADGTPPAGSRLQRGALQGKSANWYIVNGKAQHGFTGFFNYNGAEWYIEKGAVNDKITALVNVNGVRKYVSGGKVATNLTALVNASDGIWFVSKGVVDTSYTGLVSSGDKKWYVVCGCVADYYTGLIDSGWYIKNGVVDETFTGLASLYNTDFYVKNGKVDTSYTGVFNWKNENRYVHGGVADRTWRGAVTYGGSDWVVEDGVAVKVASTYDRTLFRAFKEVEKATTPDMSMEQKLYKCFEYCMKYPEKRPRTPHYLGWDWPLLYANDMFAGSGGNCCSYGAAFAFMAKAIGYSEVYACNSSGHGWTEINGRVYDPEWSKSNRYNPAQYNGYYYAVSYEANSGVAYGSVRSQWQSNPSTYGWMHVKIARSSF